MSKVSFYAIEYEKYEDVSEDKYPLTVTVHRFDRKAERDGNDLPIWRAAATTEKIIIQARFLWARGSYRYPIKLRIEKPGATPIPV